MECEDEGLEQYLEEQKAKEAEQAGEKKEGSGELKFDDDGKYWPLACPHGLSGGTPFPVHDGRNGAYR